MGLCPAGLPLLESSWKTGSGLPCVAQSTQPVQQRQGDRGKGRGEWERHLWKAPAVRYQEEPPGALYFQICHLHQNDIIAHLETKEIYD